MEPGKIISTKRWPAWLNAAALLIVSWVMIATARLLDAANGLSSQSQRLKSEVGGFLASLQAA